MNKISGFTPVYKHTVASKMKNIKFKAVTIIIALVLLLGIGAVMFFVNMPDSDDAPADFSMKIYMGDKTGLGCPDYKAIAEATGNDLLAGFSYECAEDIDEVIKAHKDENDFIAIVHEKDEDGFNISVVKTRDSKYKSSQIDRVVNGIEVVYRNYLFGVAELTGEQIAQMYMGVSYDVLDNEGNADSEGKIVATIFIVLGIIMIVYFMAIIYGAMICSDVSMEKTSKLVEQLLISVTPYGLVSGKIIGIITVSIIQFVIWVASAIFGLLGGDLLLKLMYPEYVSKISAIFDVVSDWFGANASNPFIIVFALVFLVAGIVLYLALAGVAGAMVTRPEEAGSMQLVFLAPMLICFYIVLFAVVGGEGTVSPALSVIPFASALIAPAMIILGEISLGLAALGFVLNVACTAVILLFAAKVYKALLFYSGNPLTPVKALKIIFSKPKNKQ